VGRTSREIEGRAALRPEYRALPAAGGGEAKRAFETMMTMEKIDIAAIEASAVSKPRVGAQHLWWTSVLANLRWWTISFLGDIETSLSWMFRKLLLR
jgi:hypothetical protein